jgi:hypothetical protein
VLTHRYGSRKFLLFARIMGCRRTGTVYNEAVPYRRELASGSGHLLFRSSSDPAGFVGTEKHTPRPTIPDRKGLMPRLAAARDRPLHSPEGPETIEGSSRDNTR